MSRMKPSIRILFAFVCLSHGLPVWGQSGASGSVRQHLETYRSLALQEKLFVHTDQTFYTTGDLLWFKINYVDGTFHRPLNLSKVAYLELLDKEGKPVLQTKVALADGSGNGSLFLPTTLLSGNYLVRAYTNWMKNFGPDYFFQQPIMIVNPFRKLELAAGKDSVGYDIQFFPEGGNLVQNLANTVAFRVTDAAGKGLHFQGGIVDQSNDTVARIKPLKFGMGRFSFTPSEGKQYRAVLRDANGRLVTRPLPPVREQGYTMQVEDAGNNQLRVTVRARFSSASPASVTLLTHTRLAAITADQQTLRDNTAIFTVDKQKLGDGISHLTVFDPAQKPVCERLYFKQPQRRLTIEAKPATESVATRRKVSLDVATRDATGKALSANLSVAVYRLDSLSAVGSGDISSYLYLTSDLRGTVESPAYYSGPGPEVAEALDNLMLTHGWRRFRWEAVVQNDTLVGPYVPEVNGHLIRAKLVRGETGQSAQGISTYLSVPGKHILLYTSRSRADGQIQFEMKDFYGPKDLIIQTALKDSLYRAELQNPFFDPPTAVRLSPFRLSEQEKDPLLARSVPMQVQNAYYPQNLTRYQLPKVDSVAFYGIADERYRLDDFTRFPVMEEVFREYVPGVMARKRRDGYHIMLLDLPYKQFFEDSPLVLLDGVPFFNMDKVMEINPRKVQKLEVLTRKYFVGPTIFNGIVSFTTYKGDLAGYRPDAHALLADYEGLQLPREFYTPKYDTPQQLNSRLPDFRNLLHWAPTVQTDAQGKGQLEFYTSDLEGTYRVMINGLTADGQPGSQQVDFVVKNPIK